AKFIYRAVHMAGIGGIDMTCVGVEGYFSTKVVVVNDPVIKIRGPANVHGTRQSKRYQRTSIVEKRIVQITGLCSADVLLRRTDKSGQSCVLVEIQDPIVVEMAVDEGVPVVVKRTRGQVVEAFY